MNFPAPNIQRAVSETRPFTEYLKELELQATSEEDIHVRDKTLDAIFAEEDLTLGGGCGAASAGCTAATPQD